MCPVDLGAQVDDQIYEKIRVKWRDSPPPACPDDAAARPTSCRPAAQPPTRTPHAPAHALDPCSRCHSPDMLAFGLGATLVTAQPSRRQMQAPSARPACGPRMSAADDERSALPGIFRSLFSRRKAG
jgi:hypothetical protein